MKTSAKYDAFAKFYDFAESTLEKRYFSGWRKRVWERIAPNSKVLEVGIGTGKNIMYYPDDIEVIGIDFSKGMLNKASLKIKEIASKRIKLMKMDITNMPFSQNSFDFVVSTFVFCTVPNPIEGLKEIRRVLKPQGQTIFLEHMRSDKWYNNAFLYAMDPTIKILTGTSIIRKTKENILKAGLYIVEEENVFSDIVKLMICKK